MNFAVISPMELKRQIKQKLVSIGKTNNYLGILSRDLNPAPFRRLNGEQFQIDCAISSPREVKRQVKKTIMYLSGKVNCLGIMSRDSNPASSGENMGTV